MNRWFSIFLVVVLLGIIVALMLPALTSVKERAALTSSMGSRGREQRLPSSIVLDVKGKKGKQKTWQRSQIVPNTARLLVGDEVELALKGTQYTVQVDGFRARVLMDLYYYNDKNRRLEGTFQLRLPNEGSPYFFAFGETVYLNQESSEIPFVSSPKNNNSLLSSAEIMKARTSSWSHPKEARIVPKEKAAFAYTDTVHRSIDPALMEWAGADVFNCRVFPLESRKLYHIVVGYDVNLIHLENEHLFKLPLPKSNSPVVLHFDLAAFSDFMPVINVAQEFEVSNNRVQFKLENPAENEIQIRYPSTDPLLLFSDEKEPYFAATFQPKLEEKQEFSGSDHAVFMMDVSLSSNPDKFNIWLKMIAAILNENRDVLHHFSVVFFNIEAFWWKKEWTLNTQEELHNLLTFANTLSLEGATDLGVVLNEASKPHWLSLEDRTLPKTIFLLSDSAITWGEQDLFALANRLQSQDRLFGYNTGFSGTGVREMQHLAQASGGAIFSIVSEDQILPASKAFRTAPWYIEQLTMEGTSDLLLAGRPQYIYSGQQLFLAGRGLPKENSHLTLTVAQGEVKRVIEIPFHFRISSRLARRCYGQIAVQQLEAFGTETEVYSIPYATHFRIPGESCSFLMLENKKEYQKYNIKPEEVFQAIESAPVHEIIEKTLARLGTLLGNAKVAFQNWIETLSKAPGVHLKLLNETKGLIVKMEGSCFVLPDVGLKGKLRKKTELTSSLLTALEKQKITYDLITQEAMKRKNSGVLADALKLLSSLVEKNPGNSVLARDIGFSAMEWGLYTQAHSLFKRVVKARPFEPQSYHALAQVLAKSKKIELAILYYEIALAGTWDRRFGDFKTIVGLDYLRLLQQIKNGAYRVAFPEYTTRRYQQLKKQFWQTASELAVVIMWNTDNTDIDLHVIEPSGEVCYYQHRSTKSGGQLTQDVTQGYGPEMYVLKKTQKGNYQIKVCYYSTDRNRTATRTKVYATIYQNWGESNEKVLRKVVLLEDSVVGKKAFQPIVTLLID